MSVNIAILGLGSIGMRHARNLMGLGAGVVGYDPNAEARSALEKAGGRCVSERDGVFENVQAVVIASPNDQHLSDLIACVERGLHVLIEKPLAHDATGAATVLDKARREGLIISAALNLRHHPGVAALKAALGAPDAGRVLWARFWFSDYLPRWRPAQDYRTGYTANPATGGILFDRIHEIDLANYLLGTARVVGASARRSGHLDIPSEDTADVLLEHLNGVSSSVHIDYCTPARTSECEVATEHGRWRLDLDARRLSFAPSDGASEQSEHFEGSYDDDYIAEAATFLNAIKSIEEVRCNGGDALDVLRQVVDARKMCGLPAKSSSGLVGQSISEPKQKQYSRSQDLLKRASKTIPLASQTFSKCYQQYPAGAAPLFVSHGQGGRVWDVDGNAFVDCVGGLFPLILGYRDPDVDDAVRKQLNRGISFSLSTELEAELAERLVKRVPSAEQVRFGKNGTDATSAAIRLSRARTGRDRVAVCGYHGWQDWYIGVTTRHKGIPGAVRELTHVFQYNNLGSLEELLDAHPGEFAAVIMEPMNVVEPNPGFLESVRDMTHRHGAFLIFDEIITGFRFDIGGAQTVFGVTPDMTSFGKALGNGMPISAIVGHADIMREMEEIFFSGTYGGEALSLAAGIAVLDKLDREPVIQTVMANGASLADDVMGMIKERDLQDVIAISGWPSCKFVVFKDHPAMRKEVVRTIFQREMIKNGILIINAHALSYAHDEACLTQIRAAYTATLDVLADEVKLGNVEARMDIPVIEPVFKVR